MQDGFDRRLAKATFLLLQRYHRLYGLKAHCWNKPPGNSYVSFYLDALPPSLDLITMPDMDDDRLVLTYYQDHVGIPAWTAGRQLEMPGWQAARTAQVLAWLEKHLTLDAFFRQHSKEIERWRQQYTVLDSERYLLAWQVAGLVAAKCGSYVYSPYIYLSDYQNDVHEKTVAFCNQFTDCHPKYDVMALNGVSISTKAESRIRDRENRNLWDLYCEGQSAEMIAQSIIDDLQKA